MAGLGSCQRRGLSQGCVNQRQRRSYIRCRNQKPVARSVQDIPPVGLLHEAGHEVETIRHTQAKALRQLLLHPIGDVEKFPP